MKRAALGILAILVFSFPINGFAQLVAYDGLQTLTYDGHVHPANTRTVEKMLDAAYDPAVECAHSYHWCDEVFSAARANGLDAVIQSHHSSQPGLATALAAWKSAGVDWQHPFGRQETYPTHPDGLPLAVSGGRTDSELDSLWECAEAANEPGVFLALYGGEYTVGGGMGPGACATSAGQPQCGGHKVMIFGSKPSTTCSHVDPLCADEGAVYDLIDMSGGVVNAAHPLASFATTDWTPFDPVVARGGISALHVAGAEFTPASEDFPCEGVDGVGRCGFRQALGLGHRVFPAFGSDNHNHFAATGSGCFVDVGFPGASARRGICWVDSFTRAGLIDSMQSMRCYWSSNGRLDVQWTLEGSPMGDTVASDTVGELDFELWMDDPELLLSTWELVCGEIGGGGTVSAALSDICGLGPCAFSSAVSPAADWCYLRALKSGGQIRAVSAAIRIQDTPRLCDLSGDQMVDILDVVWLMRQLGPSTCDLTGDQMVSDGDADVLRRKLAGLD